MEQQEHIKAAEFGSATWGVVCLCAEWCGVCRQYEAQFQTLSGQWPHMRFVWMDVEAQEQLLDEVDIETFPTLLIGWGSEVMFFGSLLPQIKVLERLLAALQESPVALGAGNENAALLWKNITAQWQ